MKLVKCKKCGTPIMLETNILENMYSAMLECNKKARNSKTSTERNVYIQEAIQIRKMITQIQHRTSMITERKETVLSELCELNSYITENKLITYEVLDKLKEEARKKAKVKIFEDEKEIKRIYGDFENMFSNKTKKDLTAVTALKNIK